METLETSLHLYQPPRYQAPGAAWQRTIREAVESTSEPLTWEPAALLSTLAFHYVCGDLTPIREIRRQPWLSEIGLDGQAHLLPIPPHDTVWATYSDIARQLGNLLADEAERACRGRNEIFLLLSGGLDSRVTAGTLARLYKEGRIAQMPVAVTWGLEDSRDVVYARELAGMLEMQWLHIPLDETVILRNIDWDARSLGSMIMPVHLHKMEWFSRVSPNALVLATSYGDSVGRAEYSAVHLLELKPHHPYNPRGLFLPHAYELASQTLNTELEGLRERSRGLPDYVVCEHEMHAHYTRGMLAHAMSSINDYCTVYQMFTAPEVYSYMWSLHPTLRFNEIYAELLFQLDPRLVKVPWSRTNQGLRGTSGKSRARPRFAPYRDWIAGPLYNEIVRRVQLDRIETLGVFDMDAVRSLIRDAESSQTESAPYALSWFASLTRMSQWLESLGVEMVSPFSGVTADAVLLPVSGQRDSSASLPLKQRGLLKQARTRLERSYLLRKWVRGSRRFMLRVKALRAYPPRLGIPGM